MIYDIMLDSQRKEFEERWETDFAFEIPNVARFRVNAFNQARGPGAAFRTIPTEVLTLEAINAPAIFRTLSDKHRGLVLVTGPTGSGKSTTLAAMIDYINHTKKGHILTIEDPIEFVHQSHSCLVNQREVGRHTQSFTDALRSALREDLTSCWSVRCVMLRRLALLSRRRKQAIWYLAHCTPHQPQRP